MKYLLLSLLLTIGCSERTVQDYSELENLLIGDDRAAISRLSNTKHVKELSMNKMVVVRVDYKMDNGSYAMYVGEKGPDFDFRIGFYMVSNNEVCYVNEDESGLDEKWMVIK